MTIVQPVHFEIPAEIARGLASGDLVRFGGVVRNSAGHIVTHLKEVPAAVEKAKGALERVAEKLSGNRVAFAVITSGLAVAAATAGTMAVVRARKLERIEARYIAALGVYLKGIRDGNLERDNIDELIEALDVVTEQSVSKRLQLDTGNSDTQALVETVTSYSQALADVNQPTAVAIEGIEEASEDEFQIVTLRRQLDYQRRLFGDTEGA